MNIHLDNNVPCQNNKQLLVKDNIHIVLMKVYNKYFHLDIQNDHQGIQRLSISVLWFSERL